MEQPDYCSNAVQLTDPTQSRDNTTPHQERPYTGNITKASLHACRFHFELVERDSLTTHTLTTLPLLILPQSTLMSVSSRPVPRYCLHISLTTMLSVTRERTQTRHSGLQRRAKLLKRSWECCLRILCWKRSMWGSSGVPIWETADTTTLLPKAG